LILAGVQDPLMTMVAIMGRGRAEIGD
jgi:hypothetical protein